jgi:hypothetical protein
MKLVCVNNGEMDKASNEWVNLTIGKTYETLGDNVSHNDWVFNLINDVGKRGSYHHGRFITLDKYRNDKLEKLGI